MIGPLGLHWRAVFLKRLGRVLTDAGGPIPDELSDLTRLPGVGPYAAAAYLSFHRKRRGVLLDSNIVRFYGRYLGIPSGPESRRTAVFKEIAEVATPSKHTRSYNYALLDFTRAICKPKPVCEGCPLRPGCSYGTGLTGRGRQHSDG